MTPLEIRCHSAEQALTVAGVFESQGFHYRVGFSQQEGNAGGDLLAVAVAGHTFFTVLWVGRRISWDGVPELTLFPNPPERGTLVLGYEEFEERYAYNSY